MKNQGELLLQKVEKDSGSRRKKENEIEAEACFHKAIEVARRLEAKSLELRAATSLAGRWRKQGKRNESRVLLFEIFGWFTEGFDTAEQKDAKALLDDLT